MPGYLSCLRLGVVSLLFGLVMAKSAGQPSAVNIPATATPPAAPAPLSKPPSDAPYRQSDVAVEKRVIDLIGRMSLEEKFGQLHQGAMWSLDAELVGKVEALLRAGGAGSLIWSVENPEERNKLQHIAVEQTRLGIPVLFGLDVIHGFRTVFPISLGLSCSWEPALYRSSQAVAGREARASGVDWAFAPMCDLARDPRWGRVAETCGEDPWLTSLCVAEAVHGFQGKTGGGEENVIACLKHYVGYGASIGGRDYNHTEVPEYVLRNFHLPEFRAGVKAGALTVMSSFNANDGIPGTANHHTLTDILRGEWGFKGFVVSDWESGKETINWGYAADNLQAATLCLEAGTDMEMVSTTNNELLASLKGKAGNEKFLAVVDEALRRILTVKFSCGLFDQPYIEPKNYQAALLKEDAIKLARSAVAKSTVLLKNDGVLPLSKDVKHVAVVGPFADEAGEMLGCWTGMGHREDVVTLKKALQEALPGEGRLEFVKGCEINGPSPRTKTLTDGSVVVDEHAPAPTGEFNLEAAIAAANKADVVIMALGEPAGWTGENASRAEIDITGRQQELFDAVTATGKKVVTILFCGRPLTIPKIAEKSAAVLVAWQPGVQAGPGLVDLLLGDVAPTARLTMSFPKTIGQVPVYYNLYKTGRPAESMIHYRDITREPLFHFGFGLTYTSFEYGPVKVDKNGAGRQTVSAMVKNTGAVKGEETVQLYIRQLACLEGARPAQELRGYQRVALAPGETKTVTFDLAPEVLGYWSRKGEWRCDDGAYEVWIAPHAGTGEAATVQWGK